MARSDDLTARLTGVPCFADLSRRDLDKVGRADKAYVILAGTAAVRRQGEVVATVGAGTWSARSACCRSGCAR